MQEQPRQPALSSASRFQCNPPGYQPAPDAAFTSTVPSLPADAVAKAIATAKEAAARIAASRPGAAVQQQVDPFIHAPPSEQHGTAAAGQQPDIGQGNSGRAAPVGLWHHNSGYANPSLEPAIQGGKMTAEEARRVAQQAAQRVAQLARSCAGNVDDWAWSKH
jgi:hypothetical protein